jgi:hypothetical protein
MNNTLRHVSRFRPLLGLAFTALVGSLTASPDALAFERPRTGWYLTGSTPRSVTPAPTGSSGSSAAASAKPPKDYTITHEMKALPAAKTRRGVIDADVDKRFTLHAHRDIPCTELKAALRAGFARNATTITPSANAKLQPFVDVCVGTLKAKSTVVIAYNAATKTTLVWMKTGASTSAPATATAPGLDFMKAVWSVWLGNVEAPRTADSLVARL